MYAILIIIPPMYFGFAIALNNPFDFSKNITNATSVLNDQVFANDPGLAWFIIAVIAGLLALHDNFSAKIAKRFEKVFANNNKLNFNIPPVLKNNVKWYILTMMCFKK